MLLDRVLNTLSIAAAAGVMLAFLWGALQIVTTPHRDFPCSESATSMIPACPARAAR